MQKRMTNLDVTLKRYIDAFKLIKKIKKCTNAWYQAFEAVKQ